MSQTPDQELLRNGSNFTKSIHHDTYPFIDPSKSDLSGKHVFITGASKGIGRATALSYARAGASAIGIAARSDLSSLESEIQDAAKAAGRPAPKILSVKLDVSDKASVAAAAKATEDAFGRLDVLINNAGYLSPFLQVGDSDPDEWWRTWEINIKGAYLVTRALLPLLLLEDGDKTIISLTSVGAHHVGWGGSSYQTTKLALLRFTEHLQEEYGARGLVTYCVHPGGVVTELALNMPQDRQFVLVDKAELAADAMVWLTRERREWLGGRYVSVTWDMEELVGKRDEIVQGDLLKVRLAVAPGQ